MPFHFLTPDNKAKAFDELLRAFSDAELAYIREGTQTETLDIISLYRKIHSVWRENAIPQGKQQNDTPLFYDHPLSNEWREQIFIPLFQLAQASKNLRIVALSLAWLYTLRFALGFKCDLVHRELPLIQEYKALLNQQLNSLIDINNPIPAIIEVLSFLDKEVMADWKEPTTRTWHEIDYVGANQLLIALSSIFLNASNISFEDVVTLSRVKFENTHQKRKQESIESLILALIIKAQATIQTASPEQKQAFIEAISNMPTLYSTDWCDEEIPRFLNTATPDNLAVNLASLQTALENYLPIQRTLKEFQEKSLNPQPSQGIAQPHS